MGRSVCVIVPSIGNAEELGVTLDGLLSQTYSSMEIVVVGPSRDAGKEEAESRGIRHIDDPWIQDACRCVQHCNRGDGI